MIIHYNYLYDLYIMYIIIIPFNPLHRSNFSLTVIIKHLV